MDNPTEDASTLHCDNTMTYLEVGSDSCFTQYADAHNMHIVLLELSLKSNVFNYTMENTSHL